MKLFRKYFPVNVLMWNTDKSFRSGLHATSSNSLYNACMVPVSYNLGF